MVDSTCPGGLLKYDLGRERAAETWKVDPFLYQISPKKWDPFLYQSNQF